MSEKLSYVPIMTSDTAPYPFVASASSSYASHLLPYNGFNGTVGTWCSESGVSSLNPAWLQIKLDKSTIINGYGILPYYWENNKLSYPMTFSLLGSNDGISWDTLDEQDEVLNWEEKRKDFNIIISEGYQYYRLLIKKAGRNNSGEFTYAFVGNLYLYEKSTLTKYLIQNEEGILFNLVDGTPTNIGTTDISEQTFLDYGMDEALNGEWIKEIPNAKILYWQDIKQEKLPKVRVKLEALPPNQIVLTRECNMNHVSILGITSMSADIEGNAKITITFDNGLTWKAFDGSSWINTTQDNGMDVTMFNSINGEQWQALLDVVEGKVYRLALYMDETTIVKRINIDYKNEVS